MPQPIDFQTEIAKATMAERVQSITTRISLAAQQRQTTEAEEARLQVESQVQDKGQTENPELEADGQQQSTYKRGQQQREKKESPPERPHTAPHGEGEGRHLDVSI